MTQRDSLTANEPTFSIGLPMQGEPISGVGQDTEFGLFPGEGAGVPLDPGDTTADPTVDPADVIKDEVERLRGLFPAWPDELLRIYAEAWIETGDARLALSRVQRSDEYAAAFPGLVREDGSLRFRNAQEYLAARTMFEAELRSININPAYFEQTFIDLLNSEVSPREMIDRIETAYSTVVGRSDELIRFYADVVGMEDITTEALIASFLDPRVGDEILNRRIGMAQIGAQAAFRDINIDLDLAERLFEVGVTESGAGETFSAAAEMVPIINTLARRHNDPDDDFDINEFVQASIFDDPFQRNRIRRLLNRERAKFTNFSPFSVNQAGQVRGLIAR